VILWKAAPNDPLSTWDDLMRSVEGPFAAAVEEEKNRYIQHAAETFTLNLRLTDTAFELHIANMSAIAARYDGVAIRLGLHEALKGVKSVATVLERKEGWEGLWLFLVRNWISEFGAARARETAGTTRADMQKIIDRALAAEEEFNPQQVAAKLLRAQAMSAYRAATVARTETHAAMMFASEEGAAKAGRDNGITLLKSWLPVRDERTRSNHSTMSSHPAISMDADFVVGGTRMKRPGDPRGGAYNCINCRCVLTYKEDVAQVEMM
jgi:hypothetical protein